MRSSGTTYVILAASNAFASSTLAPASSIERRNPCDGINASPILYSPYGDSSCPPENIPYTNGSCPMDTSVSHSWAPGFHCTGFCQSQTTFTYATEEIFQNSYCHGPETCTITQTTTQAVTWTFSFGTTISGSLIKGITQGISGGFTVVSQKTVAHARADSIKLDFNQCGYFTFLPIVKTSCGTLTENTYQSSIVDPDNVCPQEGSTTTPNFCASQLLYYSDGSAQGDTIFVKTDCGTRAPLPSDQQDPAYNHPGVPLPRNQYDTIAATWTNIGANVPANSIAALVPQPSIVTDSAATSKRRRSERLLRDLID